VDHLVPSLRTLCGTVDGLVGLTPFSRVLRHPGPVDTVATGGLVPVTQPQTDFFLFDIACNWTCSAGTLLEKLAEHFAGTLVKKNTYVFSPKPPLLF
jgi:hypothetical protein